MKATLTAAELDRYVARISALLEAEGWTASKLQLRAFAGVLPVDSAMPEASVVTEDEAAFVLGDSLMVASWRESDEHLVTDLFSLAGTPMTVVWNADWVAEYDLGAVEAAPSNRPVTVTFRAENGAAYALPFDAAWTNPVGCVNFATTLIMKAHGFRPGVGTEMDGMARRTWKR